MLLLMKRIATFLLIALPVVATAADAPENVVKYRQAEMKALAAHMSAISLVVKGSVASRRGLAADADAIHGVSRSLAALFPAGSGPDKTGTDAKPEIWSRGKAFQTDADALERESARLVQLARSDDRKAFAAQFARVGAACSDCHNAFRVRD